MGKAIQSGVYEIVNTVSGKRYIGSSVSVPKRWRAHKRALRHGKHHSPRLQHSWRKYGEAAFSFRFLLLCSAKDLIFFEQRCFDGLKPEYNAAPIAGTRLGVPQPAAARAAISASLIGNKRSEGLRPSEDTRAKMSRSRLGRAMPLEVRAKIGATKVGNKYFLGRQHSAETRAKMSAAQLGRTVSEEARQHIRAAAQRRVAREGRRSHSPETREKMRLAALARAAREGPRTATAETKAKMSASQKGRVHSLETISKMRVAARLREQRKREQGAAHA